MLFLFLLSFLLAEELQKVPTVFIDSHPSLAKTSRTTEWPTTQTQTTVPLNFPQVDEALNTISGIQSRTQGSPTFSIRGSGQSGRSLILYNQIPLNFASGFGAPLIFLPKEVTSQLNIIKGPASLFYGSQAMAGAIDFVAEDYQHWQANIQFSDTNESFLPHRQGKLGHQSYQLAGPLFRSNHSKIQASGFYEKDDGQYPYQMTNQSGTREFNGNELKRAVLQGHYRQNNWGMDYNALVGKQIQQSPGSIRFPVVTDTVTEGLLLSAKPYFSLSENQTIMSQISWLNSQSHFLENNQTTHTNQTTLLLQNQWVYEQSHNWQWQVLADGFFHRMDNSFFGSKLSQNNLELGAIASYNPSNGWSHKIGSRYLVNNQTFLPSFISSYQFQKWQTWLSLSRGFRYPSLSDLYAQSANFQGNPNLKPESSTQIEWGAKSHQSQSLTWELRLFRMDYHDFIESVERAPNQFSRVNQGEGYSQGLDSHLDVKMSWGFLGLSYHFLDTLNTTLHRPFRFSPEHQLILQGQYRWHKLYLDIQNTHWSHWVDFLGNQTVNMNGWQQWNFFLTLLYFKRFKIQLGLVNAFNQGKQLTLDYPEPQRRYWAQINFKF